MFESHRAISCPKKVSKWIFSSRFRPKNFQEKNVSPFFLEYLMSWKKFCHCFHSNICPKKFLPILYSPEKSLRNFFSSFLLLKFLRKFFFLIFTRKIAQIIFFYRSFSKNCSEKITSSFPLEKLPRQIFFVVFIRENCAEWIFLPHFCFKNIALTNFSSFLSEYHPEIVFSDFCHKMAKKDFCHFSVGRYGFFVEKSKILRKAKNMPKFRRAYAAHLFLRAVKLYLRPQGMYSILSVAIFPYRQQRF